MNRIAAIQMTSGPEVSANLKEADRLIGRAVDQGAGLVVLPENFAIMGKTEHDKVRVREREGHGPIQDFLSRQAATRNIWIAGGTIPIVTADDQRVRASCLLFDAAGNQLTRYDKIHLFDVYVEESGETYAESQTIEPGNHAVISETPFGRMGFAVCYDLRFPELFRHMIEGGVELLVLPAAFTALTGMAHWETLVRARAIENLCYVVASAQAGHHANGRQTYGDSMIVDPWGVVLDRLATGSGVVCAAIDKDHIAKIRRGFPALDHRKYSVRLETQRETE